MFETSSYKPEFYLMLINLANKQPIANISKVGKYVVGRASSARKGNLPIEVNDTYLSGKHFIIEVTSEFEVLLSDNGSVNGTYVCSSPESKFCLVAEKEEVILSNGDRILAGETEILIKLGTGAKPAKQSNNAGHTTVIKKSNFCF